METNNKSQKIGFLLSQFPETHETFILREFVGMKNSGLDFNIYSLKKCRDKVIHADAKLFASQTYYSPVFDLVSSIWYMVYSPRKFFKAYFCCSVNNLKSLKDFIKAQAVFFRSLYFARLMHKHGITHIHAHWMTMPTVSAEVISMILDIPFSVTAHAWDIYLSKKKSLKRKVKSSKFVVTCTGANKKYLDKIVEEREKDKIIVNYHGLDLTQFKLRKRSKFDFHQILAIGRLVEQKGFEYLMKACGVLKRKSINFQCIIIGEGPLRGKLENLRDNLGLKGLVTMPGLVDQEQIKGRLEDASVFVAPSVIAENGDRDGIPNVILEAMAMGVPVVGTKVSGIPEVVINGETGVLVSPHNIKELAHAIEDVLKGKLPMDDLIQGGRKKIQEEFNIDNNVKQLIGIFKDNR